MVFAGYGRYMNGEYVDGICNVRGGIAWYLRGMGGVCADRVVFVGVRVVLVRAVDGWECVVFAGGRSIRDERSRGICGVRVVYGVDLF